MDAINSVIIEPFKIAGNWALQAKKLQEKFPQLTNEDLKHEVGKEGELLIRLQRRLEKTRQEVIRLIKRGEPHTFRTI
jgi:hypothetical protein